MEIVVATDRLTICGGSETYVLTIGEHLARLGHTVTLYARELGEAAQRARDMALRVIATPEELPDAADGVITGQSRGLALELAGRFPQAVRLFVVHGAEEAQLPPPVAGAVHATIALNAQTEARAAASTCAGEIVRLRQPVDLRRFSIRGSPRPRPKRVLLLGNYHYGHTGRADILREAWAGGDLEWEVAGGLTPVSDVATAIAHADVVVGIGRCMVEAMACGRPAYVYDHAGSEGWITPDSYARVEAGAFAVAGARLPPDRAQLAVDLEAYRPEWGNAGRDLARVHHDARDHASALVTLLERLGPGTASAAPSTLRAFAQLAESQLRADLLAENFRREGQHWASLYRQESERWAQEHRRTEAAVATERAAWADDRRALERDRAALSASLAELTGQLAAVQRTHRYRLAGALARPLDRWRGRGGL